MPNAHKFNSSQRTNYHHDSPDHLSLLKTNKEMKFMIKTLYKEFLSPTSFPEEFYQKRKTFNMNFTQYTPEDRKRTRANSF